MFYSLHLSHFIIPESKASLMARWTWGLHSWWAAHITWQAWYLWTDGAARLNSDVCFSAIADAEMILGSETTRGVHLSTARFFWFKISTYIKISVLSFQQTVDLSHILYNVLTCTILLFWLVLSDLEPTGLFNRWGEASVLTCHTSYLLLLV